MMRTKKMLMAAIFAVAGTILTGCGSDAVERQIESEHIQFVDSIYTVNHSVEEEKEKNRILGDVTVWEEKAALIQKIKEILAGKYVGDDYSDDYEETEDNLGKDEVDWTSAESIKKKAERVKSFGIGSYILSDEKKMREYCEKLEQLGVSGLSEAMDGMVKEMEQTIETYEGEDPSTYSNFVIVASQGIQFQLDCQAEGMNGRMISSRYTVSAMVPAVQVAIPTKYSEFIRAKVKDGFCIGALNVGGYLERLNLLSDWYKPGNLYQKNVDLYFKDEKPLELDIELGKNNNFPSVEKSSEVFAEKERETVICLVNEFAGDESAAAEFVNSFTLDTGTSGTVGKAKWKLKKVDLEHTMLVIERGQE